MVKLNHESSSRLLFKAVIGLFLFSFIQQSFLNDLIFNGDLDLLDNSKLYIFNYMLKEKMFLGVQSFFTYGPLAQFLLVARGGVSILIYAGLFSIYYVTLIPLLKKVSLKFNWMRIVFCFFAFLVIAYPLVYDYEYFPLDLIIVLLTLNYYLNVGDQKLRRRYFLFLTLITIVSMLFKFSTGFDALGVWLIMLTTEALIQFDLKFIFFQTLSLVLGLFLLFFFVTGSILLWQYLWMGFETSSVYSEIDGYDFPVPFYSQIIYLIGLVPVLIFFSFSVFLSYQRISKHTLRFCFLASILWQAYCLYKHCFVRADFYHVFLIAFLLAPLLFIIGFLLFPSAHDSKEKWFKYFAFGILILIPVTMPALDFFGIFAESEFGKEPTVIKNATKHLLLTPFYNAYGLLKDPSFFYRQRDLSISRTIESSFPELAERLRRIRSSYQGPGEPTITFAPCSYLLESLAPGFKCRPYPSLQLYAATTDQELNELDSRFLTSTDSPDFIVLDRETVDDRNSISEFTPWLVNILKKYRILEKCDGQLILKKDTHLQIGIEEKSTGPGLFFRAQIGPMKIWQEIVFKIWTILFKSPQFNIYIEAENMNGAKNILWNRAFYSQLKMGAFVSFQPIDSVIESCVKDNNENTTWTKVTKAELIQNDSIIYCPLLPKVMDLNITYCRPFRY